MTDLLPARHEHPALLALGIDRGYGEGTYGEEVYGAIADDQPGFGLDYWDGTQWIDILCDARSISIDRGRSTYTEAFSAGTLTVELADFDGLYSAWNPHGIWSVGGDFVTSIPIRCFVTLQSITHTLFTGTTDSVLDTWPGTIDALTVVQATDSFKDFARHNGGPRPPVGAGDTSGQRINRLADDAGWTGGRDIDTGLVTLQATTLDGVTLDLMRTAGESEWGWLYMNRENVLTFRQRDALQTDPRMTTVQWTFTDAEAYADIAVCYGDLQLVAANDHIVNVATITPEGVVGAQAIDQPSIDHFGPKTYTRTDLPLADYAQALGTAQVIVLEYASDDLRVDGLTFDALHHGTLAVSCAAELRMNDRIRLGRTFPGGYALDTELLVQGIRHDITPSGFDRRPGSWSVEVRTASAALIAGFGFWDEDPWDEDAAAEPTEWGL